jgi:hypothetical protein
MLYIAGIAMAGIALVSLFQYLTAQRRLPIDVAFTPTAKIPERLFALPVDQLRSTVESCLPEIRGVTILRQEERSIVFDARPGINRLDDVGGLVGRITFASDSRGSKYAAEAQSKSFDTAFAALEGFERQLRKTLAARGHRPIDTQ